MNQKRKEKWPVETQGRTTAIRLSTLILIRIQRCLVNLAALMAVMAVGPVPATLGVVIVIQAETVEVRVPPAAVAVAAVEETNVSFLKIENKRMAAPVVPIVCPPEERRI